MTRNASSANSDDEEPGGNCSNSGENCVILGTVEPVKISGKEFMARIDTGAARSAICESLVEELDLGPPIKRVEVRSANGHSVRNVIKTPVELAGKKMAATFNVSDRAHMTFDVLIGRNVLKRGFLIDPKK